MEYEYRLSKTERKESMKERLIAESHKVKLVNGRREGTADRINNRFPIENKNIELLR